MRLRRVLAIALAAAALAPHRAQPARTEELLGLGNRAKTRPPSRHSGSSHARAWRPADDLLPAGVERRPNRPRPSTPSTRRTSWSAQDFMADRYWRFPIADVVVDAEQLHHDVQGPEGGAPEPVARAAAALRRGSCAASLGRACRSFCLSSCSWQPRWD